jgi:hypothetical protein
MYWQTPAQIATGHLRAFDAWARAKADHVADLAGHRAAHDPDGTDVARKELPGYGQAGEKPVVTV